MRDLPTQGPTDGWTDTPSCIDESEKKRESQKGRNGGNKKKGKLVIQRQNEKRSTKLYVQTKILLVAAYPIMEMIISASGESELGGEEESFYCQRGKNAD